MNWLLIIVFHVGFGGAVVQLPMPDKATCWATANQFTSQWFRDRTDANGQSHIGGSAIDGWNCVELPK